MMRIAFGVGLALAAAWLSFPAAAETAVAIQVAQSQPDAGGDARKAELDFWNAIKSSKKAEDYQAYLDKYPNGDFSDLAKLRLKKYAQPAAAAPAPAPAAVDPQQAEIKYWNTIKTSKKA